MEMGKRTAVARLLLLPWILSGFLHAALGQEACNAAEVVLGEGEQHTFSEEAYGFKAARILFMKPGTSFEGIGVHALGKDGTEQTAWFPAEEECFPGDDAWLKMVAFVEIKTENSAIDFGLRIGKCSRICEVDNAPLHLQTLNVVPQGTSNWTTNFPNNKQRCRLNELPATFESHKRSTCNKPEPTLSTGVIIGIILAVIAGVAVCTAVAVKHREKIKQLWTRFSGAARLTPAGTQDTELGQPDTPNLQTELTPLAPAPQ